MPFYKDYSDENATILYWKYSEEDHFEIDELIEPENLEKAKDYHPKKLIEHLMVRKLLKMVLPDRKILYKTAGEPYLWPPAAQISITHSFPFAALAISKNRIGIDLEKVNDKILRIKKKFLHPNEIAWTEGKQNEVELITIIWVIKESLYKVHLSKYWSLKDYYEVSPFDVNNLGEVKCRVFDDFFSHEFTARVSKVEDFYFAIVEEKRDFVED